MIRHHPPQEMLLDYASGAQPEALALPVAGHVEMCAECRREVAELQELGAVLLHELEPAEVDDRMLDVLISRLDEESAPPEAVSRAERAASPVPKALRPYVGANLEEQNWQSVGGLFDEAKLALSAAGFRVSLLRARPGQFVPMHSHAGHEYMLVLAGGYRDNGAHYVRGDFSHSDAGHHHAPKADPDEDCVCLLVLDAPLAFTDELGRGIDPLLRM